MRWKSSRMSGSACFGALRARLRSLWTQQRCTAAAATLRRWHGATRDCRRRCRAPEPAISTRLGTPPPRHPSLQFRQVHTARPIYSARVGLGYRALAVIEGEVVIWFWIVTHAEYDRLLRSL